MVMYKQVKGYPTQKFCEVVSSVRLFSFLSVHDDQFQKKWYGFNLIQDKKEWAGEKRPLHHHVYKLQAALMARQTLLSIVIDREFATLQTDS